MGWPGCFLRISRACRTGRAPRWSKTCHQPCPVSTDTPEHSPAPESGATTGATAPPSDLRPPCTFPTRRCLGLRVMCWGFKADPPNLWDAHVAHVLQQMGLRWRKESLMTSVRRPEWQGRAPDRSTMLGLGKQRARDLSTVAE